MKIKKLMALSLLSASMGIAYAGPNLILNNDTEFFVTSKINNFACSSSLPGGSGVTKPHEQHHVVNGTVLSGACLLNPTNCTADVYLDKSCGSQGGAYIAHVTLDKNKGVKDIQTFGAYKVIAINPFELTLRRK